MKQFCETYCYQDFFVLFYLYSQQKEFIMAEKGGNNKYSALYNDHEDNVKVEIAGVNAIDVDITLIECNDNRYAKL